MKKTVSFVLLALVLLFSQPLVSFAEVSHSEQQELSEQSEHPSALREKIEGIEENVLGSENHKKFEVLDPIFENPIIFSTILAVIILLVILGIRRIRSKK
jgi:predicted permease